MIVKLASKLFENVSILHKKYGHKKLRSGQNHNLIISKLVKHAGTEKFITSRLETFSLVMFGELQEIP